MCVCVPYTSNSNPETQANGEASEHSSERRGAGERRPARDGGRASPGKPAGEGDRRREERVVLDVLKKNPSGLRRLVEV